MDEYTITLTSAEAAAVIGALWLTGQVDGYTENGSEDSAAAKIAEATGLIPGMPAEDQ